MKYYWFLKINLAFFPLKKESNMPFGNQFWQKYTNLIYGSCHIATPTYSACKIRASCLILSWLGMHFKVMHYSTQDYGWRFIKSNNFLIMLCFFGSLVDPKLRVSSYFHSSFSSISSPCGEGGGSNSTGPIFQPYGALIKTYSKHNLN